MPGRDRASPDEILLFLNDVSERLTMVTLDESEYFRVLQNAGAGGIIGGATYDAIIAQCALKAKAQIIYTWNTKHFNRLGSLVASRVREPDYR